MRILMLGIALLALSTFAFADNTADNTAQGNIVLTVAEAFQILPVAAGAMGTIDFGDTATTVGGTGATFSWKANHNASLSASMVTVPAVGTWKIALDGATFGTTASSNITPSMTGAARVDANVTGVTAANSGDYTLVVKVDIASR